MVMPIVSARRMSLLVSYCFEGHHIAQPGTARATVRDPASPSRVMPIPVGFTARQEPRAGSLCDVTFAMRWTADQGRTPALPRSVGRVRRLAGRAWHGPLFRGYR